jgi:hypothetical protein
VTVNELLSLPAAERPGRLVEQEQMVNVEANLTLVTAANGHYELVARANAERRYPAECEAAVVYRVVQDAVVEIRAGIAAAGRAREGR